MALKIVVAVAWGICAALIQVAFHLDLVQGIVVAFVGGVMGGFFWAWAMTRR